MLAKILTAWCEYLSGPDSLYVLNDTPAGWKSDDAQRVTGMDQFEYDPDDERWGFSSWNDFVTRRFLEGERPVAAPKNDKVIVSACESTPCKISVDVELQSSFWTKGQPYSLQDMLANDEAAAQFVGGTVYQAFLSAANHHRWHSPVAGTIVRAFVQPGTYDSEADAEGADAVEPSNPGPGGRRRTDPQAGRGIVPVGEPIRRPDQRILCWPCSGPGRHQRPHRCAVGREVRRREGHEVVRGRQRGVRRTAAGRVPPSRAGPGVFGFEKPGPGPARPGQAPVGVPSPAAAVVSLSRTGTSRTTTCLDTGVLLPSATDSSGTSTLASG